jgi:hypothetical protein
MVGDKEAMESPFATMYSEMLPREIFLYEDTSHGGFECTPKTLSGRPDPPETRDNSANTNVSAMMRVLNRRELTHPKSPRDTSARKFTFDGISPASTVEDRSNEEREIVTEGRSNMESGREDCYQSDAAPMDELEQDDVASPLAKAKDSKGYVESKQPEATDSSLANIRATAVEDSQSSGDSSSPSHFVVKLFKENHAPSPVRKLNPVIRLIDLDMDLDVEKELSAIVTTVDGAAHSNSSSHWWSCCSAMDTFNEDSVERAATVALQRISTAPPPPVEEDRNSDQLPMSTLDVCSNEFGRFLGINQMYPLTTVPEESEREVLELLSDIDEKAPSDEAPETSEAATTVPEKEVMPITVLTTRKTATGILSIEPTPTKSDLEKTRNELDNMADMELLDDLLKDEIDSYHVAPNLKEEVDVARARSKEKPSTKESDATSVNNEYLVGTLDAIVAKLKRSMAQTTERVDDSLHMTTRALHTTSFDLEPAPSDEMENRSTLL